MKKDFNSLFWMQFFGLAGLGLVIALLALSLANEYQQADMHAQHEVENLSRLLQEQAQATVQKVDLLLRDVQGHVRSGDMRARPNAGSRRAKELHALLKIRQESVADVSALHLTNARGDLVYSSAEPLHQMNISDRYHFMRQRDDPAAGMVISPPLISRTTGKWSLILSRRLNFEDGSFAGIVNAVLDMEHFQSLFRSLELGDHGSVVMFDRDFHIAARFPPSEKDMGKKIAGLTVENFLNKGMKNGVYQARSQLDGIERKFSFRQVGDYPLIMIAGIAKDDYLAEWHRHLWQYIAGTAVFIFALLGFGLLQRQATRALHRESEKNIALLRNASDGIHILDASGNIIEASDSFCSMMGYRREEMLGMNVTQWDANFTLEEIPKVVAEQFAKQSRSQFETRHKRKDGSIFDVEVSGFPLVLNGKPALFNSSRDITERKKIEKALQLSEHRLRTIIEAEPECVKVVDNQGRLLEMNSAGLAMLEAGSLEEAQRYGLLDYVVPEDRAAFLALHKKVMNGESGTLQFQVMGLKGTPRWLETHATPMRDANGDLTLLLGVTRDITESKKSEQQQRIAATAFESQEGMIVTDANGVILRVNHAFTAITGYTAAEMVGKNPRLLNSGRHDEAFFATMWTNIKNTGSWEGEIWNRRKSGEVYPERLTITAVKDANGSITNYVAAFADITKNKASEIEIQNLAFYDPLTALPNRRLLQDRLQQALVSSIRSGKEGAILFIDLDNFKNLNDTLGHDIGDLLLKQVAQRLVSCVREGDTVARLGGDEFMVLLEDLSGQPLEAAAQTEAVGQKILVALNQPYQLSVYEHHSTPSIGATLFIDCQQPIENLLKQADIAMYQAKKAGRNALRFYDPQMQEVINNRAALEGDLRKALLNNEFRLHFQIQMDSSGRPIGAEALIRWVHPVNGLVSPAQFIPLSEETGLILQIGQWVLETACAQLKIWQQHELTRDLMLAVNVSAKQFRQADFADQVRSVVSRYGIDPALLKLELTESMLQENIETTISTMNTLKGIGIQFSLDDFGTGYSSLQYIKRLPLNQLKIDQSFVSDVVSDSSDKAIVSTIIAMAKSMNLDVIAEGVETAEQQQFLLDSGCVHYQGYLFSKPVPIEIFEVLLKHGKARIQP